MSIDILFVKSVTGGSEAFFSSNQVNGYNLTRDVPLPSIPVLDSWIKYKGYTTDYFDLDRNGHDGLLEKANDADVIGFYLNFSVHFKVMDAVKRVKNRFPEKIVVIGGPSILDLKENFYNLSSSRFPLLVKEKVGLYADAIVYGDGEIALETILHHKDNPDEIGNLIDNDHESSWGIIYKDTKGKIHVSTKPGLVSELSLLPIPNHEIYKNLIPVAFVETSRGCPFGCPFCEMPDLSTSFRVKDRKQIITEIDYLQQIGINHVIITDPSIYPSNRMDMLSEIFAGRGMKWTGFAKPGLWNSSEPFYSKETLRKAKDSGCAVLFFGGESASEKTQKLYSKPKLEVLLEMEHRCKEVGLLSCWSFMILNPGETRQDVDRLINLVTEMEPGMCVFSPFLLMPNSEMDKHPKEYNLRITDPNYKLKAAELYAKFSSNAGAEKKEKIGHMIEKYPRLMRFLLKLRMHKVNYFECIETGFGLSDGAFEMLRVESTLNRNTNIQVGKSHYHLLIEMAAAEG
ncbi:MAG TPA: B12-binding domain-containing radical SAM protein [Dehalococcoidia bacterium]|nr:B12-binding domain-containing radical SAM protein [Dehalococcoidia bacterium]